jgi:SET domain-containing protein
LFAAEPIRAGTPIIEFKGRIISWETGALMLLRGANHVIKFDANHDLDARPQWSAAGHVNHGCYPNCAIKKKRDGLWLTSIRPIQQGEELLIDYNFDLGEEFEPCRCGHPRCRGLMLRKKDWPKLRKIIAKASNKKSRKR